MEITNCAADKKSEDADAFINNTPNDEEAGDDNEDRTPKYIAKVIGS